MPPVGSVQYVSSVYARLRPLRTNNAVSDLILVDHVPGGYSVKGFAQQIRAMKADVAKG